MPLLLDISGFEALFQVNYKPMVMAAYRIIRDKDIAEDVVQDIFIRLWEKRDSITIAVSLKSYLFQSTVNQSLNYIRKIKNVKAREGFYHADTAPGENTMEEPFSLIETSKRIDDAIGLLPVACRTIFILSRYEHLSYKEIAQKLEISVKTVENQMAKALKHLRRCLIS